MVAFCVAATLVADNILDEETYRRVYGDRVALERAFVGGLALLQTVGIVAQGASLRLRRVSTLALATTGTSLVAVGANAVFGLVGHCCG